MTVPHLSSRWHCTQHRRTLEDRPGSGTENRLKTVHAALRRPGTTIPPHLPEESGALLGHLRRVLVQLQRPRELLHEEVGLVGMILRNLLHLVFQEHQATVPSIQLIPHILRSKAFCSVLPSDLKQKLTFKR